MVWWVRGEIGEWVKGRGDWDGGWGGGSSLVLIALFSQ